MFGSAQHFLNHPVHTFRMENHKCLLADAFRIFSQPLQASAKYLKFARPFPYTLFSNNYSLIHSPFDAIVI
jgi:hypothetical protein